MTPTPLPRVMRTLTGPFARQGAVSVADQVLLSGTNFVAGLLLARHAAPADYGAYVLGFTVMVFFGGLHLALVTTPLTILAAPLDGEALRGHVSTLTAGTLVLGAACAVATLIAAAGVKLLLPASQLAPVLFALAPGLPFIQTQEACRRVLFLRMRPGRVLVNDILDCGLQLIMLLLLLAHDAGRPVAARLLTGPMVILTIGASALASTVLGLWQIRALLTHRLRGRAAAILRASWSLGKFGLGAQLGQGLAQHANRFIAAGFAGTAGLAIIEAPRLLVAPLQVIGTGAGNLTLPKATRRYAAGGMRAMLRFLTPVTALWGAAFVGYAALVAVGAPFWLKLAYAGKYDSSRWILLVWCAASALMGLRVMPGIALRATRNLRPAMTASLLSGIAVVVVSFAACAALGPGGAAIAKLVGEVVLLVTLTVFFVRLVRGRYDAPAAAPAAVADVETE